MGYAYFSDTKEKNCNIYYTYKNVYQLCYTSEGKIRLGIIPPGQRVAEINSITCKLDNTKIKECTLWGTDALLTALCTSPSIPGMTNIRVAAVEYSGFGTADAKCQQKKALDVPTHVTAMTLCTGGVLKHTASVHVHYEYDEDANEGWSFGIWYPYSNKFTELVSGDIRGSSYVFCSLTSMDYGITYVIQSSGQSLIYLISNTRTQVRSVISSAETVASACWYTKKDFCALTVEQKLFCSQDVDYDLQKKSPQRLYCWGGVSWVINYNSAIFTSSPHLKTESFQIARTDSPVAVDSRKSLESGVPGVTSYAPISYLPDTNLHILVIDNELTVSDDRKRQLLDLKDAMNTAYNTIITDAFLISPDFRAYGCMGGYAGALLGINDVNLATIINLIKTNILEILPTITIVPIISEIPEGAGSYWFEKQTSTLSCNTPLKTQYGDCERIYPLALCAIALLPPVGKATSIDTAQECDGTLYGSSMCLPSVLNVILSSMCTEGRQQNIYNGACRIGITYKHIDEWLKYYKDGRLNDYIELRPHSRSAYATAITKMNEYINELATSTASLTILTAVNDIGTPCGYALHGFASTGINDNIGKVITICPFGSQQRPNELRRTFYHELTHVVVDTVDSIPGVDIGIYGIKMCRDLLRVYDGSVVVADCLTFLAENRVETTASNREFTAQTNEKPIEQIKGSNMRAINHNCTITFEASVAHATICVANALKNDITIPQALLLGSNLPRGGARLKFEDAAYGCTGTGGVHSPVKLRPHESVCTTYDVEKNCFNGYRVSRGEHATLSINFVYAYTHNAEIDAQYDDVSTTCSTTGSNLQTIANVVGIPHSSDVDL